MIKKTIFDGVEIDDVSLDVMLNLLLKDYQKKSGIKLIVTPNIDHFQRLKKNDDIHFTRAYVDATYRLCDSRIVQKLSLLSDSKINNVVPGSDLTKALLTTDWITSSRVTVIGTSEKEIEILKFKYGLNHVVHYNPPMGFIKSDIEIEKCADLIMSSNPDFVFLAVGSPAQEVVACRLMEICKKIKDFNAIVLCIGASLDFISGKTKRAPVWLQKMNLEWMHRALSQPRRLIPRYMNNFKYIILYLCKFSK